MIQRLWTSTRNALLVLFAARLFATDSGAQTLPQRQLGTNLTEVVDYSHQLPFTDIFKFSREWLTQCRSGIDPGCTASNAFDTEESNQLDLDANGWVRSLPAPSDPKLFTRVATFWDVPSDFPAGTYVVLYDGEGTLEYALGASKTLTSSSPGRDIVEVTPAQGGILLRIAETNPTNYIRNIRMALLSEEFLLPTQIFRPQFLNRLNPYQALRFMDWMRTNNSQVTSWESRSVPSDARYSTGKGVPPEVMIELCNTTQKAPWFTIPHQATDSYVLSFASLTRSLLLPSLTIYIEYSNEAWNSVFSQGAYMEQRAEIEWPGSPESGFTKRINWYGKRSAEICGIWKTVFSDAPGRVVCVVASQAANSWTAEQALTCPLWDDGPCVNHRVSALAIAPYIGDYVGQEDSQSTVSSWATQEDGGLDKLFSELTIGGELPGGPIRGALSQSFDWIAENRLVAQNFNIALLAYEGGQHLVGVGSASDNTALTSLFTSANRDSRMGEVYTSYLTGWNEGGGQLFMHFTDISSYSKFGSWGALEATMQSSSPKYDALKQYVSAGAPPTAQPSATPTSAPPQQQDEMLVVRLRGAGRVQSTPSGIECPGRCSASFSSGAAIRLRARPPRGSVFIRWRGACRTSRRTCVVTMTQPQRVGATFARRTRS
jgi:hypothetical protein